MEETYEGLMGQAASYIEAKDYTNAEPLLENVFHNYNHSVPIAELLLVVYYENNHYKEALQAVDFIHRHSEEEEMRPDLLLNGAILHQWTGNIEESLNFAEHMIATYAPHLEKSDLDDIFRQYAHSLLEAGRTTEAKGLLDRFLLEDKSLPYNKYLLAKYHNRLGQYQQSIQIAQPLLGTPRHDLAIRLLLIDNHYQLESYSVCFELINEDYALYSDHLHFRVWKGIELFATGNKKEAENLVDGVQEEFNDFYMALRVLGDIYQKTSRPRMAAIYFESAIKHGSWNDDTVGTYALYLAKHKPDEFELEELLNLAQEETYPKLAYYLGQIYADVEQNFEKAIEWLLVGEQKLPEHIATKSKLAEIYNATGKTDEATAKTQEILTINPAYQVTTNS